MKRAESDAVTGHGSWQIIAGFASLYPQIPPMRKRNFPATRREYLTGGPPGRFGNEKGAEPTSPAPFSE